MSAIALVPLNTMIALQKLVMLLALGVVIVQSGGDALDMLIALFCADGAA